MFFTYMMTFHIAITKYFWKGSKKTEKIKAANIRHVLSLTVPSPPTAHNSAYHTGSVEVVKKQFLPCKMKNKQTKNTSQATNSGSCGFSCFCLPVRTTLQGVNAICQKKESGAFARSNSNRQLVLPSSFIKSRTKLKNKGCLIKAPSSMKNKEGHIKRWRHEPIK